MTKIPRQIVLMLLIVSLATSCITTGQPPRGFLQTEDHSPDQWLDAGVDPHFTDVRIRLLPLTDAFAGMRIAVTKADAPVEMMRVTLHVQGITRRQALWLLSRKYGLNFTIQRVPGQPPYIGISKS